MEKLWATCALRSSALRRNISACANSDSACRLSTNFVISKLCASSSACLTWSIWSFKLLISSPSISLRCSYYSLVLEYFCSRSYQTHDAYSFFQMPLLCSRLASNEGQYITLLQITMCVCVCMCACVRALCVCVRVIPVEQAQDPTLTSLCSHLMLRLWISEHPPHCEDPCF
jgi:hypothetical protein